MKGKMYYMTSGAILTLFVLVMLFALFAHTTQAHQAVTARQSVKTNGLDGQPEALESPVTEPVEGSELVPQESVDSVTIVSSGTASGSSVTGAMNQDDPKKNYDEIIRQVEQLNEKFILGLDTESNWFHIQFHNLVPVTSRGSVTASNGTNLTDLYPADTTVDDYWFSLNDYSTYIHHVSDLNNNLLQRAASVNGETVNLTLMALGLSTYRFPTPAESDASMLQGHSLTILRELRESEEITARSENGQYTVTVIDYFSEVTEFDNVAEPLVAHRYQVIFDEASGAIQYEEFAFQTVSGEWLIMEARSQFVHEEQKELPDEAQQTMEQVANLIEGEN